MHFAAFSPGGANGAEFDIDAPLPRLCQFQPCERCGLGLVVTGLRPGTTVRCGSCRHHQRRLADEHLVLRLYQGCPSCGSWLDAAGSKAGEWAECGGCLRVQPILPAVAEFPARVREHNRAALAAARRAAPPPSPESEAPPTPSSSSPMSTPPPLVALAARSATDSAYFQPPSTPVAVSGAWPSPAPAPVAAAPDGLAVDHRTESSEAPPATAVVTVPTVTREMFMDPEDFDAPRPVAKPAPRARPAAAVAASASAPAAVDGNGGPAAVWVNGEAIPAARVDVLVRPALDALRREIGRVAEQPEGRELLAKKEAKLRDEITDALIDRALARQAAERRGIVPDNDEVQTLWDRLRQKDPGAPPGELWARAHEEALLAALRAQFRERVAVGPETARRHYRDNAADFHRPAGMNLRGLVIFNDRTGRADPRPAAVIADELAGRLERGERFDQLAAAYDELPGAAPNAPNAPNDKTAPDEPMPEVFWGPAARLALGYARPGAVAGPLELPNAIGFCRLERRRPAGPAPFDAVGPAIVERLEREGGQRNFAEWLRRERANAAIHN